MQSGPRGLDTTRSDGSSRTIARKIRAPPAEPERHDPAGLTLRLVSDDEAERAGAVALLRDQDALRELACSSPHQDVRLASVSRLSDEEGLAEIAAFSHFSDSRLEALRRVRGREGLVWVASSTHFGDARKLAIGSMDDDERAEVAILSRKPRAREAALAAIRDAPSIIRVANESLSRSTRRKAVGRLKDDVEALSGIALGGPGAEERKEAVRHLCPHLRRLGPDVLVEVAALAGVEDYRLLAVAMLSSDAGSLRSVLRKSRHWGTRTAAIMLISEIVGEVDDANTLTDIAVLSPDRDGRRAALAKLSADPQALQEVARRSRYRDTRRAALLRLAGDGDSLRRIRMTASYPDTRRKAHALAGGKETLRKTLEKLLSRT
jgi:hypothetical protein